MKVIIKVMLAVAALWVANHIFLAILAPSGVWVRREVREHPLARPMAVTQVNGVSVVADGHSYSIGGIAIPGTPEDLAALTEFVIVATAQGIEIDESAVLPAGQSIRCEPRVWHWCGNDPVAAHYQQMNLNEIVLALGYAQLAQDVHDMTTPAALRLRAAAQYANDDPTQSERRKSLKHGINISAIMCVESAIRTYAYDLEQAHK